MDNEQGYGEAIPDLEPLDPHTEQTISNMMTAFAAMTEAEVLKDFERYDFRDVHGHPLTHAIDFMALVRLAKKGTGSKSKRSPAPTLPEPMMRTVYG